MSYTPTTWETGDTITAEKLNNMEQGIANASGPLIVNITSIPDDEFSNLALDKTWQEIHDALLSNGVTIIKHETDEGFDQYIIGILQYVIHDESQDYPYIVTEGEISYTATTASGILQTRFTE